MFPVEHSLKFIALKKSYLCCSSLVGNFIFERLKKLGVNVNSHGTFYCALKANGF